MKSLGTWAIELQNFFNMTDKYHRGVGSCNAHAGALVA
jgi:hypothetical protein